MSKFSLSKDKIKILLLEGVHKSALETLQSNGYTNIEYLKTSLPEDELIEKMKDVHFVGIRSRTHITEAVVEAARRLDGAFLQVCRVLVLRLSVEVG